jgi:RNA polymerase sigma factor (TIGR02999 family)
MPDITALIEEARQGSNEAWDHLFSTLYGDLRRLASGRLKSVDVPTLLDTTSLVHESYLRFLKAGQIHIRDRAHFLAYAGRVMRSVIVDFIRERNAQRRGGHDERVSCDAELLPALARESEIIRVHNALDELAAVSERLVRVVEMRYFGGMNAEEIAEALGLTQRTVRRDWEKARIVLASALK